MADLVEMVIEFVFFLVTSFTRLFFKNQSIPKYWRLTLALLLFASPCLTLLYFTSTFISINIWWIYLTVILAEVYFGYLSIKYTKGILFGFND
ncbi:hypothetical protein [Marinilactibacillus kalidii]|uniref:hypothetical protein n=1 Tax=Marinilactibacillus kalidii TaxID=2820274 RepID=UPI001ABD9C69|nr:hypothetical protein [Marinilactibacillus kalidii]